MVARERRSHHRHPGAPPLQSSHRTIPPTSSTHHLSRGPIGAETRGDQRRRGRARAGCGRPTGKQQFRERFNNMPQETLSAHGRATALTQPRSSEPIPCNSVCASSFSASRTSTPGEREKCAAARQQHLYSVAGAQVPCSLAMRRDSSLSLSLCLWQRRCVWQR